MSTEGSERDHANQIQQASNQPWGAAERGGYDWTSHRAISDYIRRFYTPQWRWCDDEQLSATRGLDTPTAKDEADAVRGIGDGEVYHGGNL